MPPVQPGTQLDHYLIEELIAKTGTSSIFKGADVRSGRPVALKVPHPEVEGDLVFYNRFLREREIYEMLDHPAVARGIADAERSRVYIAMELAPGRLLRGILHEKGRLPADRAVRIAVAICEALDYLHGRGVVHRDLKPENVLVDNEVHGDDCVKLVDFGIASKAGASRLTFGKLSQVMGTPDYIAPEQVRGKRGDRRADIYALGVVLYEMLTGEVPFPGNNELIRMNSRLLNQPCPPRDLNPEVSCELQEVVLRALERDPKRRYQSARDMAHDLSHQDRVCVSARGQSGNARGESDRAERRPWVFGWLLAIPAAIFALLLYVAR